jgi:hypothetical protein
VIDLVQLKTDNTCLPSEIECEKCGMGSPL